MHELVIDDVFDAYFDCRKCKRNSINQLRFEADLESNLVALFHDLKSGDYKIGRSIAFVVTHPKIREVWAADFRDRVVHHVIYNAISERFYRRFIRDSYACIPGRGTHDGLNRVNGFARSITQNYTRKAWAMKLDVANFFNSIDKHALLSILDRYVEDGWLRGLIHQVTLHDPRTDAFYKSPQGLFDKVPPHKSLIRAAGGVGLPIGNLTSQFFANVYMNELDQFVKHGLKARYYGRYVDDMLLFHDDPVVLNSWAVQIDRFLQEKLSMRLHPNKTKSNLVQNGFDFIGFVVKPGRVYLRQTSLCRAREKIRAWEKNGSPMDAESIQNLSDTVTSYLAMLRQVNGYRARRSLCRRIGNNLFLHADEDYTKLIPALKASDAKT
ncbi:RNA-directed DNA polymerase [Pseudomonas aeruginosa]|uniref:RNA-directed DNA polymerase n=1 Tax=Pseudomonas aeruginosa TaxID=287 RepID=UPI003457A28A